MNVQRAHPTTATRKHTVITLMVHFAAHVKVVSVVTVSATATVCQFSIIMCSLVYSIYIILRINSTTILRGTFNKYVYIPFDCGPFELKVKTVIYPFCLHVPNE